MEEFCAAEMWGHIFGISSFVGGVGARMNEKFHLSSLKPSFKFGK